ncbi:hypothetical protein [Streptomyces sp. GbtcB6]|uniref:DUF7739 domain-containing protein n=1 Tax=Streptomyces sp. GbtcB6 TaxID=2824751 RepID=UPI001C30A786|nr:hypothetical protein [Streptomyces sp. GbtcB6]
MTRKPAITDAEPHMVVSHGADFFGEDRHPLKVLASIAGYAEGCLSATARRPLVDLLKDPGEGGAIPPDKAVAVAELLMKIARHRWTKAPAAAHARALADAADRAAEAGEPWEWRRES